MKNKILAVLIFAAALFLGSCQNSEKSDTTVSSPDGNITFSVTMKDGSPVYNVTKDGAADKAGIKTDDIILAINDVEVNTIAYFQHELYKYKVGEKIKITIERNGEEKTLVVKLGSKNKEA